MKDEINLKSINLLFFIARIYMNVGREKTREKNQECINKIKSKDMKAKESRNLSLIQLPNEKIASLIMMLVIHRNFRQNNVLNESICKKLAEKNLI